MKIQVSSYFDEIIESINKRKEILFQQIDDKFTTLSMSPIQQYHHKHYNHSTSFIITETTLKENEQKITKDVQTCTTVIAAAASTFSHNPTIGMMMLQV